MRLARWVSGLFVVAASLGPSLTSVVDAAKPNPVCRQCRASCLEDVASCAAADPRLASCSAKRQAFCLRRATKACRRNLRTCCTRTCRKTGLVVCCGSALSPRGSTTTTLLGDTTSTTLGGSTTSTTLVGGDIPCNTDAECATCGCCNLITHTCGPYTGSSVANCCNPAGQSTVLQQGICGPKTPAVCPAMATCAPPGMLAGGIRYDCQWCVGSGAIIEQFSPSGQLPQSYPSNACTRN